MDIHHLKVFQTAARTGSFTAAGRDLSLSQSTVSMHIKHLEEEFGCPLFRRSAKRVELSEAGRVLLQYVDRTFTELKNAELAVREFSTSQQGTIRMGVGASTLAYLLPGVLAEYHRRYPRIDIRITTGVTESLLQSLRDHALDFCIVMSPAAALNTVQCVPLIEEELVMVFSSDYSLAASGALLPSHLDQLPLISHLRGTAMKTVQSGYFDSTGFQPRIVMELENMEAIKALVRNNVGAALLPVCSVSGVHGQGLVHKAIDGLPMSRKLFLASNDWDAHPPAIRRLARRILRTLASTEASGANLGHAWPA